MSAVLKLNIAVDMMKCISIDELDKVEEKYKNVFSNAVDATEFSRMISIKKYELQMKG